MATPKELDYKNLRKKNDAIMGKRIMITSATAGIGEATARLYAEHGYHLILTGRRDNLLQTPKTNLKINLGLKSKL